MGNADKKPLISVIVPVYKVEQYLCDCIDSILMQTYANLEVILVDDGSPDRCPVICDEYEKIDSRIKVIHKENGGLSDARNAGLKLSTGEYLMFVDSDDLLTENSVEIMYHLAETYSVPLVIGGYQRIEKNNDAIIQPGEVYIKQLNQTEAMEDMFRNGCAAWTRLYHRTIHQDILFPQGEINEDEAIVLQLLGRCGSVVITNQVVYLYRCRAESITSSSFSTKKLDWIRHCKANLEWIRANHPELENVAAARYRGSLLWSLTEMALADGDYRSEVKTLVGELKVNLRLFRRIPYQYLTDKIRAFLLTYLPFEFYRNFIRVKRNY